MIRVFRNALQDILEAVDVNVIALFGYLTEFLAAVVFDPICIRLGFQDYA
jgi:hypothetical protein